VASQQRQAQASTGRLAQQQPTRTPASTAQHLQQQLAALCSSRAATEVTGLQVLVLLQQAAGMVLLLAVTKQHLRLLVTAQLAAGTALVRLLLLVGMVLRQLLARTGSSNNSSRSRLMRPSSSRSSSSMALLQGMVLLLQVATGSKRMRSRARTVLGMGSSLLHSSRCISRSVLLAFQDR
jgi:hypothetical protein